MKYTKPPLTISDQLDLLSKRKLIIPDLERAQRYLESVGYYRLSGYMFHLQHKNTDDTTFYDGTTFDQIIGLYTFDKKLRSIFLEYLERIEVCFRTKVLNTYSTDTFYWYLNPKNFIQKNKESDRDHEVLTYQKYVLDSITKTFEDPKETFLKAFKAKYTSEAYPPEIMSFETLSFGKLIKLYTCLKNDDIKNSVAIYFGLPSRDSLIKWLLFLNDVRNVCAHHSRLWNRRFTANKILFPSRKDYKIKGSLPEFSNSNIYGAIIVMNHLLHRFNPSNSFTDRVESLIAEYGIEEKNLGFPEDWRDNAPWKIK